MTLKDAQQIAAELTEMSTTGEDFLAGEINGGITIDRWDDTESYVMSVEDAIQYADVFIQDGIKKVKLARKFLEERDE